MTSLSIISAYSSKFLKLELNSFKKCWYSYPACLVDFLFNACCLYKTYINKILTFSQATLMLIYYLCPISYFSKNIPFIMILIRPFSQCDLVNYSNVCKLDAFILSIYLTSPILSVSDFHNANIHIYYIACIYEFFKVYYEYY